MAKARFMGRHVAGLPVVQNFLREYMLDKDVRAAGIRAGLTFDESRRLMERPDVLAEVDRLRADLQVRHPNLNLDAVVEEIGALAFSDMGNYIAFDADDQPYFKLNGLSPRLTKAIQSLEIEEFIADDPELFTADGNPLPRRVRKVKLRLYNKSQALVDLGRHLGLRGQPEKVGDTTNNFVTQVTMNIQPANPDEDRSYRDTIESIAEEP